MNLFLHHRDLRITDNTTLIYQFQHEKDVTPIFIFPPEQIDSKKNKYFSNNSVQFMIESLCELSDEIKKKDGEMYFFQGDTMDVIKDIHKKIGIKSLGWNIDYTPYAKRRDQLLREYCKKIGITFYEKEDYLLYDILEGATLKKDGKPYLVFTPFKNHCMQNLEVRKINSFSKFIFRKNTELTKIKGNLTVNQIHTFYKNNPDIHVHGGRSKGLAILKNIGKFKDYDQKRNFLTYQTTSLSAYNHFTCVSIREVYHATVAKLGVGSGIINELHWRDFYSGICHFFPRVLEGQVSKGGNKCFLEKYEKLKWIWNKDWFDAWCDGKTGFPIVDAAMRQMNTTGFMHNRGRMITSIFLFKFLHIDFRFGEKYFAHKLVDYSPMQNSGGHQWSGSIGSNSQPYYRYFNFFLQAEKYDPNCEYIKKWIPELRDVPSKDILKWDETCEYWLKEKKINYFKPIIDPKIEVKKMFEMFTSLHI